MFQVCLSCLLSRCLLTKGISRYLVIIASSLFELPANERNKSSCVNNILYVRRKWLRLKDHTVDREQTLCDVCLNRIPAFYRRNDVCALKHGQSDIDRIAIKNAGKARGNNA